MPVPQWLTPYASRYDATRDTLSAPQKLLFDSLWERACGDTKPFLSMRERDVLLNMMDPKP